MDLYRQVRGGPVEDDETGDYGAARNIAEEHEDPTQDFRWSPDVLFACDKLPALKSEEVKTLGSLLGLSSTSLPVGVKDFLVAFEGHPDHCQQLRKLAQQLKSLGREDLVSAMHREKAALRWLGPVLPEGHLVRDLVPSLWVPLTVKLSLSHPQGYDWKWLAEQLSIPRDFIDLWEQQGGVPADKVLKAWQVKVSEATVGRLFDLLIEHREDLAAML
ncbi:uncharacterized protein LOC122946453 isoform X2 [Bufo gargarizans]|uniref:uncharacterized protein LOC122946453 isoform X2 n=1 Tax=Bufo gargarizans TaxID=30331 RepID=UPI001CF4209D|nr:uncharacterized protein LOC122946453 isoform X2 [Bufo gargarizans]